MFNVGGGELLVIMLIALIVLGPQRLPDAARTVGRVMGDLRRISSGFQQELKDAFDDGDTARPAPRKESTPLAASVAEADQAAAALPAPVDDGRADAAGPPAPVTDAEAAEGADAADGPRAGEGSTVAPAVAAALDEIVAPLAPPGERPVASGSAGPETTDAAAAADEPGDDALGDERAAS